MWPAEYADSSAVGEQAISALANTSYASSVSPSSKRCVANTVGSSLPSTISCSSLGGGIGVDRTGRDRDVLDPELLEVQRRRAAVDADVRNPASWADELGAELERCGDADGFDRNVGAEPIGQLEHARGCVLAAVVDRHIRADADRLGESRGLEVDRDDPSGRIELRRQDRGESDRAGADDRDRVTRSDLPLRTPTS
jgi:hypothetical protein